MTLPDAWTKLLLGSLSGELESHPGRKLSDHLLESALLAEALLEKHGLETFAEVVPQAALTHDCAKAQPSFQKHLYGGKGIEHAAPSSFFSLPLNKKLIASDLFIMAEAVRRHHTHLQDWNDSAGIWESENFAEHMVEMKALLPSWPWDGIDSIVEQINDFLLDNNPDETENKELTADCWFRLRATLSLLVAADRMSAIGLDEALFHKLPEFKEKVFTVRGEIDEWRSDVARECLKKLLTLTVAPGIYTLTLPTGAGKTNIGMHCAHTIANRLSYETIIYALPFISVVEQNADFAREVFGSEYVQEDHSLALNKAYEVKKDDKLLSSNNELWQRLTTLFRYWNSPIIATTMVQLWDTIYNPKALASIDFHRLSRAVVILDEPQGIDCRHWQEFGETLSYISKKFGTVFILMTATQPQIAVAQELTPSPINFPLTRHRYKFLKDSCYKLEDLPNILLENCADFSEKPGMAVFNTRKSALEAYRILKPLLGENTYMLSGWMTPNHKRLVLKKITEHLKKGELCHLVATQTVEAGVDLDFDWVFRDIGPLDSVIQAAGRCNRSALRDKGIVLVAELCDKDSSNKPYASMVYDPVILSTTKEFLQQHCEFEDNEVGELVKRYYEILKPKLCPNGLWKNICRGLWGKFIPLFEDNKKEVTLYIDDGEVDTLLHKLQNLQPSLKNRDEIKWIRTKLAQHSVGVSPKLLTEWIEAEVCVVTSGSSKIERWGDSEFYIVRSGGIGSSDTSIYHTTVGFQPQSVSGGDGLL